MIDILDLINKGQTTLDTKRLKEEQLKFGNLRGGMAGILTEKGEVYGKCHRLHHLRTLGIEIPKDKNVQPMFDMGVANELMIVEKLKAEDTYKILTEDEYPVSWEFDGNLATGRPDIVLIDKITDRPVLGLELKNISSIYTARNILADLRPNNEHLIQAAFYSWRLGIQANDGVPVPWQVVYTSGQNWHLLYNKRLMAAFEDRVDVCNFEGMPKVVPTRRAFALKWELDGTLRYKDTQSNGPSIRTAITQHALESYFRAVADMGPSKKLGPIPSNLHVTGEKSYRQCQYCELASTCKETEEYEQWLDGVKLEISKLKKERA